MKTLFIMLLAATFSAATLQADETPVQPDKHSAKKHQFSRQGRPGGRFNPMMFTARMVMKELQTYQTNPTPENYQALEKALKEAMQKDTARRKAELEKELAELPQTQAKRAEEFLAKVKSGEFKMPERFSKKSPGKFKKPGHKNK